MKVPKEYPGSFREHGEALYTPQWAALQNEQRILGKFFWLIIRQEFTTLREMVRHITVVQVHDDDAIAFRQSGSQPQE
ncbi:MAG TPA: hypothetical protein VE954_19880 [Oligoflexus sp.]|uniref:hypothetical protein n=1 Tax=Oligoflexus sp. TaxID=1971216 RepID=UPI002D2CC998|nr:hypothetical protein [Oligoflexus sp.]HYX35361.1 hypothetical protein [Oligoflexus sp.]